MLRAQSTQPGTFANITGVPGVGNVLTATLPPGMTGTLQWTRTLIAAPFTKTAISGAVASAVNSLAYTVQSADLGYVLGVDCSNQVSSSVGAAVSAAPNPGVISNAVGSSAVGAFAI